MSHLVDLSANLQRILFAVGESRGSVIIGVTFNRRGRIGSMVLGSSRGGHPTGRLLGFGVDRQTTQRGVEPVGIEEWTEALARSMSEGAALVTHQLGGVEEELLRLLGRSHASGWTQAARLDLALVAEELLRHGVALPGVSLADLAGALELPAPPEGDPLAAWIASAAVWDLLLLPELQGLESPSAPDLERRERSVGDPSSVPAIWLPEIERRVVRMNERLLEAAAPALRLHQEGRRVAPWPAGGDPLVSLVDLRLELEEPLRLGAWALLGALELQEGYAEARFLPAPGIGERLSHQQLAALLADESRCESCGDTQALRWLLLSDEGQLVAACQDCLARTSGAEVLPTLRLLAELHALVPDPIEPPSSWPIPEPLLAVRATLDRAARIAVRDGWQGRLDPEPTAALVAAWNGAEILGDRETLAVYEGHYARTAEADDLAAAASRHLNAILEIAQTTLGDFERTLLIAVRSGYHRSNESGLVGSAVVPALREIERARSRSEAGGFSVGAGFIGGLGEALVDLEVEILEIREFPSDWGPRLRLRARTADGEQVAWWSKPRPEIVRGARLRIDGSVRSHEHDRADALPRTELERVVITAVKRLEPPIS